MDTLFARFVGPANFGKPVTEGVAVSGTKRFIIT